MSSCSFQFSQCKPVGSVWGQLLFPRLWLQLVPGCSFTFSCSFQGGWAVKGREGEGQRGKSFIQMLFHKHCWVSSIWSIKKLQELFVSFLVEGNICLVWVCWASWCQGKCSEGNSFRIWSWCSNSCCRCLWFQNVREEVARTFSNAGWGAECRCFLRFLLQLFALKFLESRKYLLIF